MISLLKINVFVSPRREHKAPCQHIPLVLAISFRAVSLILDRIFVIPKREMLDNVGFYHRQFDI